MCAATPMSPEALLDLLRRRGARVCRDATGGLEVAAPPGVITEEIDRLLQAHHVALVRFLEAEEALGAGPPQGAPCPDPSRLLPGAAWDGLCSLLLREEGTWHHADEISARLGIPAATPERVQEALDFLTGEGLLERRRGAQATVPVVRSGAWTRAEAVYYCLPEDQPDQESGATRDLPGRQADQDAGF